MKKILPLFLIAFLCWPPTAAAEGLVHLPGEWNIGVGLKTSTPGLGTDWGEFNVDNETLDMSHMTPNRAPPAWVLTCRAFIF